MSDIENPWQSPQNSSVPETPPAYHAALNSAMLRYLREASPWLRFIGIMGFIGSAFTILGGIVTALFSSALSALMEDFSDFPSWLFGFIYAVIGVIAFFPARFTYLFGAKIRDYMLSNSEEALEAALKNNRSLWKFSGIICIIYLALIPVAIIIGIIALIAFM